MNAAVDKYEPGTRTNSAWGELASESWAAGLLFADAAKAGNLGANGSTPTSAELVQGLAALKGDTLDGFASPLTFTPGKANPDDCWFQAVIKNGAYSTPAGLTPQCETSS
jgi:branched-chain amino acid transport system substrate-binding protein